MSAKKRARTVEIVQLTLDGWGMERLARRYNVNRNVITNILARYVRRHLDELLASDDPKHNALAQRFMNSRYLSKFDPYHHPAIKVDPVEDLSDLTDDSGIDEEAEAEDLNWG